MIWYLKQLLPLRYETTYGENGNRYFEIWRMWFGRCFNQRRYRLHVEKSPKKPFTAVYADGS